MRVSKPANIQYAALPWRQTNGALEVLLITTLRTGRWIVPKGWPLADLSPCDCAAREALEEAGLLGEIASEPFGAFRYAKQKKSGEAVTCRVEVFPDGSGAPAPQLGGERPPSPRLVPDQRSHEARRRSRLAPPDRQVRTRASNGGASETRRRGAHGFNTLTTFAF